MGLLNYMPGESYGIPDDTQKQGLLDNPFLHMGLSILAANNGRQSLASTLGQGAIQGLNTSSAFRQQQAEADWRKKQTELQQARFAQEQQSYQQSQAQNEAKLKASNALTADLNLDPNLLAAYPEIGADIIKSRLLPKPKKIAYTPNGIAYDENNPDINIGGSYAKPDTASNSSLAKMISEMNALPQGSPARAIYQKAINKEINFAPPMVVQNYPAPMAAINPTTGQPELVQFGNKGDAKPTGFKPVNADKAPTEGQAKAATFHSQMTSASNELNNLTQSGGYDPTSLTGQVGTTIASGITNPLAGEGSQRARQAQNQWAESFLRVKTGAAATKDEVKMNVETFFPKVGDTPAVIEQKARMRAQAENDVKAMTANPNNILSKNSQLAPKQPVKNQQKSKSIKLDNGKSVIGILGADGSYYVTQGGKKYKVEE